MTGPRQPGRLGGGAAGELGGWGAGELAGGQKAERPENREGGNREDGKAAGPRSWAAEQSSGRKAESPGGVA